MTFDLPLPCGMYSVHVCVGSDVVVHVLYIQFACYLPFIYIHEYIHTSIYMNTASNSAAAIAVAVESLSVVSSVCCENEDSGENI